MTIKNLTTLIVGVFLTVISCTACSVRPNALTIANQNLERLNHPRKAIPRTSFVQIKKDILVKYCQNGMCVIKTFKASASGSIIQKDQNGTVVLTAAHVCRTKAPYLKILGEIIKIYDINQKEYASQITAIDEENDICLLRTNKIIPHKSLSLSSHNPRQGDRVYNVAAPLGIATKNLVPIFQGFFIGSARDPQKRIQDYYSMFATNGSSGSPVIDHHGKLIGMVTQAHRRVPLAVGPKWSILKKFILENKNK